MLVYLAGEREISTNAEGAASMWSVHVKRRLFSYYYHGALTGNRPSHHVLRAKDIGNDLFLDSGAFTAFTKNVVITPEQYAGYIHQTAGVWTVHSCLDAIGDAAGSYRNLRALEDLGCAVQPVFHCREDVSWLVKYLDAGYDYIFLGGMVPETTRWLTGWLDWLWGDYLTNKDGTPRVKVHGFGLTDQQLMFRYPWFSVDSSSWLMTGVFGTCVFLTGNGLRKVVFSDNSPERKKVDGWHYATLPAQLKKEVDTWLVEFGVTAEQLATHYSYRDVVNAATYTRMEPLGAKTFIRRQEGLFDA